MWFCTYWLLYWRSGQNKSQHHRKDQPYYTSSSTSIRHSEKYTQWNRWNHNAFVCCGPLLASESKTSAVCREMWTRQIGRLGSAIYVESWPDVCPVFFQFHRRWIQARVWRSLTKEATSLSTVGSLVIPHLIWCGTVTLPQAYYGWIQSCTTTQTVTWSCSMSTGRMVDCTCARQTTHYIWPTAQSN